MATLAVATTMVLAGLGGMYDPAPGYEEESRLLGWAWVAVWGGLGLRAMTLGVSVRGDRLRIRNLWRTRDLSIADVESVDTDLYEGWLFGYVHTAWVRVVRVRLRGRWVRVWGLTSRPGTAARLARRLEAACGLQPNPRAWPRHSRRCPGGDRSPGEQRRKRSPHVVVGCDPAAMWEDERAPLWRRQARLWTAATLLLLAGAAAALMVLALSNEGWALLAALVLSAGAFWTQSNAGLFRGRLQRPARKAALRAAKAARQERAAQCARDS